MSVPPPPIDDASIALIESGQAAKVFADAAEGNRRATLVHAYACRVDPDRRRVPVTLDRAQAGPYWPHLSSSRRVALVACHIETLKSLQLKGDDAQVVVPATAGPHGRRRPRRGICPASAAPSGTARPMMRAHMQLPRRGHRRHRLHGAPGLRADPGSGRRPAPGGTTR